MSFETALALVFAAASTTLTNVAYLREHDAAASLPVLCLRRPLHSVGILVHDRSWMLGFAMESTGFLLYAVALALASLALVQSITAGGIGVLAYVSARLAGRGLRGSELTGVILATVGLLALAVSLAGGSGGGGTGAASAGGAALVLTLGRQAFGAAAAYGIAGGILFSIGDISTKIATQGGGRSLFIVPLIAGYALGTALLQIGYQAGGALSVAGLATLLTNALPIAAGTVILDEAVPHGAFGVLRVLAFAAVTAGAVLLARPEKSTPAGSPVPRELASAG